MKSPWIPICASFTAGIIFAPLHHEHLLGLKTSLLLCAASFVILAAAGRRIPALLAALLSFAWCGAILHTMDMSPSDPRHISRAERFAGIDLQYPLEITGQIRQEPERSPDRLQLVIDLRKIAQGGREHRACGLLQVNVRLSAGWSGRELPFRCGDVIRFLSVLEAPRRPGNPGGFDYALYLKRRGVYFRAGVKSPLAVEMLARGGLPGLAQISSLRSLFLRIIRDNFSEGDHVTQNGALLQAVLLGERGFISPESESVLRWAGLLHIIAISGFHVWVFALLTVMLLRCLRVPYRADMVVTAVAVAAYWALSGGRSSAGRACIVAVVYLIGKALGKRAFSINSIAFAAFLILVFSPTELYDAGFQLTFAAALSIVLLYPPLEGLSSAAVGAIPLGENAPAFIPPLLDYLAKALSISAAAQLGVLPLLALHFNIVVPHSLLTNIILQPIASLIIIIGFPFLLLAATLPFLAFAPAWALSLLSGLFLEAAGFFSRLLPVAIRLPSPPLWLILVYFPAMVLWALAERCGRMRAAGTLTLLAAITLTVWNPFAAPPTGAYRVHAIDVGQGNSFLLEFPDGRAALVDGGGSVFGDFDVGENLVSRFLWHRGHRRLALMISTHSDVDHLRGLTSVAENFPVDELWLSAAAERTVDLTRLLEILDRGNTAIRTLERGETLQCNGCRWVFMNPPSEHYRGEESSNNNSLVFLLQMGENRLLFPGDAECRALEDISSAYGRQLRCDVLQVSHHGSGDALQEDFLSLAAPRIAIICVGAGNVHGFPDPEVLDALRRLGARVLRTDLHGAVSLTLSGNYIDLETVFNK